MIFKIIKRNYPSEPSKVKGYRHATEEELKEFCKNNSPKENMILRACGTEKTMSRGGKGYAGMKVQEYTDGRKPTWEEYNCSFGAGAARGTYFLMAETTEK